MTVMSVAQPVVMLVATMMLVVDVVLRTQVMMV
jgi:hypothetical protein